MPSTGAELLAGCLSHRTQRTEFAQQRAALARADAADLLEDRGQVGALAQIALELDREAVSLVANALEQQQRGAARRQQDRVLARRQVELLGLEAAVAAHALRVADPVALLRDADRVEFDARVVQRCHRDAELSLAAVHHQQVGQRIALALREASREHFAQAGEVVARGSVANPVAAIAVLVRLAVGEGDAARHRQRAAQRRDVVTLDAARQTRERQPLLQIRQRRLDVGARVESLRELEFGVGVRHRDRVRAADRAAACAAPRAGRRARPASRATRRLRDFQRHQHLARHDPIGHGVVLDQERAERLGVVEHDFGEGVRDVPDDATGAHVEHRDLDFTAPSGPAEHVPIDRALADDLLALHRLLDRRDAIAQPRRVFETLLARSARHRVAEFAQQFVGAAAQEERRALDELGVARGVDQVAARRQATLHLVLDAGPAAPAVVAEHRIGTGAQREDAAQVRDRLAQRLARRVGTEVRRAVVLEAAHRRRARPRFARVEAQAEVLLVVAEAHVEGRLVALDQLVLEQQGVLHRRRHDHVEIRRALDHLRDLHAPVAARPEVRAHATLQVLRLADVDHPPARIAEQIDPGSRRQRLDALFDRHGNRKPSRPLTRVRLGRVRGRAGS